MKISICTGPIQQGRPRKQWEIYRREILRAIADDADVIILAADFPGTYASPKRKLERSFCRTAQEMRAQLAALAPDRLIVGQTSPDAKIPGGCWIAFGGHIRTGRTLHFRYRNQRLLITTNLRCDADNEALQICLLRSPFDKYGSHRPSLPDHTLCISPLGIHDRGRIIDVYDGAIYYAAVPHGTHALQDTPYTLHHINGELISTDPASHENKEPSISAVMRFGIKEICDRWQIGPIVIGLSGGIDSALNLMLYRSIFDPSHLIAVNMPSAYNSPTTRHIAQDLANALDVPYLVIPIDAFAHAARQQLNEIMATYQVQKSVSDFVFENMQARDRSARVLAALAAMYQGVFTCNANKTELTIGYGTMYGDISGFLCATGDLWKHEIYALAQELNHVRYDGSALPPDILTLPPSAELSPAQNPEKGGGDPLYYPYHDRLFQSWTEGPAPMDLTDTIHLYRQGKLTDKIHADVDLHQLFPTENEFLHDARKWWRMYRGLAVAKRMQSPPILALSPYPLGTHAEAQHETESAPSDME